MKKTILIALIGLLVLICGIACAETYVLDPIYASVDIPSEYDVVLVPGKLDTYATWLEARGKSADAVAEDFEKRGVLLQAWDEDNNRIFEVRAVQTDTTQMVFDVNQQDTGWRGIYRTSHYPDNTYDDNTYSSADWKNTGDNGRFLVLKYTRRESGEILYRGNMRRTIRNGYEIDLDMQVYNRALSAADNSALNAIWHTFNFIEVRDLPPVASAKINFTAAPPKETNAQNFNITGTAADGVSFTAVVMGLSYPEPVVSQATVGKNGKFSIPVKLPREGVFLVTLTAEYRGEQVLETAYPVTYERTMLYVSFNKEPGSSVNQEQVDFNGLAEAGASIQVFLDGSQIFTKKVNTAGKFAFSVDLTEERTYEIGVVFTKKGLSDRRFTYSVTRRYSNADQLKYLKAQAVKPAYKSLVNKISTYEDKVIGYTGYIVDIAESGGDYIVKMALGKKNKVYNSFFLVTTTEKPEFSVGERVDVYGTCEGMSLSVLNSDGSEEEENYPVLSLLLFVSREK